MSSYIFFRFRIFSLDKSGGLSTVKTFNCNYLHSSYRMERIKELNNFTEAALSLGIILLTYGFICQIVPINFFWESKSVGYVLISLGLVGLLISGIEKRKANSKKTILNKIGIGIISFMLFIQAIIIVVIPKTDAYNVSKNFIINSNELTSEVGKINGFGLFPVGGISIQKDSKGEKGNATINLIIKGEKAYKSVTVLVHKDYGQDWEVYGIE